MARQLQRTERCERDLYIEDAAGICSYGVFSVVERVYGVDLRALSPPPVRSLHAKEVAPAPRRNLCFSQRKPPEMGRASIQI
jgi:hypothetical protein